ncbi:D-alanyl-D-alanine carboxypeptidase [Ectothiorhodospiraceae bacterium 2226]|nr:D-alanyl-D-alanine carboxypeptidase [Ectothiorhodospiraceae bacterium 2226]
MTSRILLLGLLLALLTAPVGASSIIPAAPAIAAKGYLLMDFHSGQVLAEENADAPLEPASLTKIMTAYVVFHELAQGNIALDDEVLVSEKAWRMPGSRMFIEVNNRVSVEDLLKGMIIQSGNDASVALAEHVAGGEDAFALLMNNHARQLGMNHSNFLNSTGLPQADHITTARDMALLARALIERFPEYYGWYSERSFTYNGITQHNRNRLLWRDESVDGFKTGHTNAAGYCLVASGQRGDMRLISVLLGAANENARAAESHKLLNYGFRFFETHRLYAANEALTDIRIWRGAAETLPVGLTEPLYITVPRGQYDNLKATMAIDGQIVAPTEKGREHGFVHVTLGDRELASRPLVALDDVGEGGLWQRLVDNVKLMFQ